MLKKLTPDALPPDDPALPSAGAHWTTIAFAIIILTPSMIGFGMKFIEFIHTFQGDQSGAFAITPMVNYLLASLGFLCLLLWSIVNGTFHDMEQPKLAMLEQEERLDGGWQMEGTANDGI